MECISTARAVVIINGSTTNDFRLHKAIDNEVSNAKYILRCFEIFSGLNINFKKSCLEDFDVKEETLFRMAAICKCKIGSLPINYLGIPLGANSKRITTWEPIIDRVRKKLSSWMSRTLSWAGKVVLINTILSSLSIFFMSLFNTPMTIIKKDRQY
ncbi:DExH-box ATP-dependent RNA helicase DExH10-like [Gossypium australe]|uniref:DExH-box ATP-dependent RNA helicase DExH10-like n=1 Tax=Gossypium australe TaxID=47621 RepID=A0A5B6WUI0_9ROSI|nr:DExH-box ATP-dependent RNA helicase DExH10-like [Gossypium australe]